MPAESVPHSLEHAFPSWLSVQLTSLAPGSLLTVATNCCWRPVPRRMESGEIETEIVEATVTVMTADLVGSATAVAAINALLPLGALAGASYSTEVLSCLLSAPGPVSFQVTPLLEGSLTTTAAIVVD